jgi:polysaccharide biosynthesis/export protein
MSRVVLFFFSGSNVMRGSPKNNPLGSLSFSLIFFLFFLNSPFVLNCWAQETDSSGSSQTSGDDLAAPATQEGADTAGLTNVSDADSETAGGVLGPNYTIGAEDIIGIDVFDVSELKGLTVRVANDGTISLPLLGQVRAAGLTAEQLRHELEEKWGETYLQDPQVTIFVKQFKAKPVSVIGSVEKPGLYPLTGRRTLIEMLSMAGGLGKKGSAPPGRMVLVTRRGGFGDLKLVDGMHLRDPEQVEIDLNRLLYTRDKALDIEIHPRDVISVTKAPVVYVIGAVGKPGGFVLEDQPNITVLQALALADGVSGDAAKKKARIVRTDKDGKKTEIHIDLGKLVNGKTEDLSLTANDVLIVPNSTGKVAGRRATEAAIGTVTGWLIWRR